MSKEAVETVSRPRFGHGGARAGAGRKRGIPNRWPGVLQAELRQLVAAVDRLHEQRRDEHEALPMLLKRITSIERRLGIVEVPATPRTSRRNPRGRDVVSCARPRQDATRSSQITEQTEVPT